MAKDVQAAFITAWPDIRFILIYCAIGVSLMALMSVAYKWDRYVRAWIPLITLFWPFFLALCGLFELYKLVQRMAVKIFGKGASNEQL